MRHTAKRPTITVHQASNANLRVGTPVAAGSSMSKSSAFLLLLPLLSMAPACDTEPSSPQAVELRNGAFVEGLSEDFALSLRFEQLGSERWVEPLEALGCHPWQGSVIRTEEVSTQCLDGEVHTVTLLCEHHFACKDGEWQGTYSTCVNDGEYPRFESTGEPCSVEA